jgi:C4-dicarboxylate-specific signal transduction histidine kinase
MPLTHIVSQTKKILIVDDEEINREIVTAPLRIEGYELLGAESGEEALKLVETQQLDLVILDVVMPGMDGFEVCRRIREEMKQLTLPVVFITALNDRDSRVRGKAVGCDDFLTKPVDPIELNARVRNLLRVKAYHDLRARQEEMLQEELARMRDQLIRADRLASLGTLAAGVGHELNNILSVLQMTVELMRQRSAQNLPFREKDFERLNTVALHMGTHAKHLLNLGRPGPQFEEKLDLRDVVKQTLDMLRVAGRTKTVQMETTMPEQPVMAEVNRTRIEQVVVNLVGNAVDALSETHGRERRIRVNVCASEQGRISCSVEDNGSGIPANKLESIFEPYYTTKPVGQGTGLGLPVVKNIVESYGGKVSVKSTENLGTTVSFDLPSERLTTRVVTLPEAGVSERRLI